jgi:putative phage-type endonuclease
MIIHDVEQRSEEWYRLRAGKPTASECNRMITTTGLVSKSLSGYAMTLACETFAGQPVDAWEGNQWTERGRAMEDEAIRLYEFATDSTVEKIGFVTTDDGIMGCSPDGFVGDDGMIEIKCLKAERHADVILYYGRNRRAPADYIVQAQAQMLVCERAWCDLVFYHPILPLLVIRQAPDPHLRNNIRNVLPGLCRERDEITAALRAQDGSVTAPRRIPAPPPVAISVNLAEKPSVF